MRSAPIGAFFAGSPDQIDDYVRASTRLTHTDPRALVGATAVARLASWSVTDSLDQRPPLDAFLSLLEGCGHGDDEWAQIVERIGDAAGEDAPVAALAASLGLENGVTGYVYHTVPVAAYAWYYHRGDFRASLETVLECGGDTDTAGAIVGALAGAVAGASAIPREWIEGLCDWPRGRALLERLAVRLDQAIRTGEPGPPERYFWPGLVARNLLFTVVVLAHGMRRLGPPY